MARFHYWIFTVTWTVLLAAWHEAQARGWHPQPGFTKTMGYSALVVGLLAFRSHDLCPLFVVCIAVAAPKWQEEKEASPRRRGRQSLGSQLKWEHKTPVGIYIHVGRGMIAHH
jgi:hypothetical protein